MYAHSNYKYLSYFTAVQTQFRTWRNTHHGRQILFNPPSWYTYTWTTTYRPFPSTTSHPFPSKIITIWNWSLLFSFYFLTGCQDFLARFTGMEHRSSRKSSSHVTSNGSSSPWGWSFIVVCDLYWTHPICNLSQPVLHMNGHKYYMCQGCALY